MRFGAAVATAGTPLAAGYESSDGMVVAVSAPEADMVTSGATYIQAGAVYIYHQSDVQDWQLQRVVKPLDLKTESSYSQWFLGQNLAASGRLLVMSARISGEAFGRQHGHRGRVFALRRNGADTWGEPAEISSAAGLQPLLFGAALDAMDSSLGSAGNRMTLVVGEPGRDMVHTFVSYLDRDEHEWMEDSVIDGTAIAGDAALQGSSPHFGSSLAISQHRPFQKEMLVVGAVNDQQMGNMVGSGAVYVFMRQGDSTWRLDSKLLHPGLGHAASKLGTHVALEGREGGLHRRDLIAAAAPLADQHNRSNTGEQWDVSDAGEASLSDPCLIRSS